MELDDEDDDDQDDEDDDEEEDVEEDEEEDVDDFDFDVDVEVPEAAQELSAVDKVLEDSSLVDEVQELSSWSFMMRLCVVATK